MSEQKTIEQLKQDAAKARHDAEVAAYNYAKALDVGAERTKAFQCYENIRRSWIDA